MFAGLDDPALQTICKFLYCVTFLRGTCDSLCFWIVDKHARKVVHSFIERLMSKKIHVEEDADSLISIDDYFGAMHCHEVSNKGDRREEKDNVVSIHMDFDRIYGIDKS